MPPHFLLVSFFFFNDTATTEIYTLSLHDALPISKLAFTRHPGSWSRKHYRGSFASDLWLMDVRSRKFTKLGDADYKGNYLWPMYGRNGEIYFVADRLPEEKERYVKFGGPEVMKSANNIWKISARGGLPV